MSKMGNKVLPVKTVSRPASTAGGYPLTSFKPYEAALNPPPSQGRGPNSSPGEGAGVYMEE